MDARFAFVSSTYVECGSGLLILFGMNSEKKVEVRKETKTGETTKSQKNKKTKKRREKRRDKAKV